jgi:hypothetical protein
MRSKLALLAILAATAVPGAALVAPTAASAETRCGTITARGTTLSIHVTYGTFKCASAKSLYRAYFRKVNPRSDDPRTVAISRGGKSFRCQAGRTGPFEFICFPKAGVSSKPIVAADRRS